MGKDQQAPPDHVEHLISASASRNLGILSSSAQHALQESVVAIAGVGGDGGLVAELLVRLGVRDLRIADPERFEVENLNRQAFCNVATIGERKVNAVAEGLRAINPDIAITTFEDGITRENVDDFVAGADLVIDETEYTRHELAVLLGRAARAHGLVMLTGFNIAFGAAVTAFASDGVSIERFLGLGEDWPLEAIAASDVPLERWLQRLPAYVPIEVIGQVAAGERPAPSVAPGVALAAGLVASAAVALLTGGTPPAIAPSVLYFDASELRLELVMHDL